MSRKTEYIIWGFAMFLIGLAFFFGLFIDLTGDSALYATITRQMVESGDWLSLKLHGVPYDQKPYLLFWLAGIGVNLFGNNNFAFKLFPFLYGLAGIYFTYRLGRQLFTERVGRLSALIAATSQIYFLYFFDIHTDSVIQTGVILALWKLAAYLQDKRSVDFVLGFVGIGLAMLAKGPIGAVLPFFSVLLYLIFQKEFRQIFHPKWPLGIIIAFAFVTPTLINLYHNFGIEGLKFFFITNNIGRITGEYAGSSTEWLYYAHTLLWAFLPWTLFVVVAIISEIKNWFYNKNKSSWSFYLLGSVLILLFILSIARGKAPNYFLIAVVPITVLTANMLVEVEKNTSKRINVLYKSQIVFSVVFAAGFIFVLAYLSFVNVWLSVVIAFALVAFSVYFINQKRVTLNNVLLVSLLVAGGLNLFLTTAVLPKLFSYQGARQVLMIFDEHKNTGSKLCNFETEGNELYFYSDEKVTHVSGWNELRDVMKQKDIWLYTNEIKYNDIMKMKFDIDTVYIIKQRGMNHIRFEFLNPSTRENSLDTNYIIVTSNK